MALVKLRKASFVLVCLLIILLLWPGQAFLAGKGVQSEFAGGSGTEDDPYLIATAQQLAQVNNYLDACFKLIADINLDLAPYNRGKGWEPIGSGDEPFTGSFDGNGRIIRTLYINREDEDCIGLFGVTGLGSSLRSIKLEEVKIRGRNYVGGLVGLIYEGNIDDCYVSGTVRGEKDTGGLVGLASCIIRNCYTNCTVGGADNAGGIAGSNWGTLTGSYAAGQVTGREAVGGLVGCNEWFVEDTYVCGTVRGSEQVGGLVGFNNEGHIYNSYATGTVQGDRDTGGLVGFSD
ncbi:MAG: GLUG motif-containing protein, partial [bacterium]